MTLGQSENIVDNGENEGDCGHLSKGNVPGTVSLSQGGKTKISFVPGVPQGELARGLLPRTCGDGTALGEVRKDGQLGRGEKLIGEKALATGREPARP